MVRLNNGTNTLTFSPNRDLPYGSTGRLYLTIKNRSTGKTKSTYTDTESYADAPRAVTMTIRINDGGEATETGYLELTAPEFPAGYYSYLLYQANADQELHLLIDVGVLYYDITSGEGAVIWTNPPLTIDYKIYQK